MRPQQGPAILISDAELKQRHADLKAGGGSNPANQTPGRNCIARTVGQQATAPVWNSPRAIRTSSHGRRGADIISQQDRHASEAKQSIILRGTWIASRFALA